MGGSPMGGLLVGREAILSLTLEPVGVGLLCQVGSQKICLQVPICETRTGREKIYLQCQPFASIDCPYFDKIRHTLRRYTSWEIWLIYCDWMRHNPCSEARQAHAASHHCFLAAAWGKQEIRPTWRWQNTNKDQILKLKNRMIKVLGESVKCYILILKSRILSLATTASNIIAQWHPNPTKLRGGVRLYIHMLYVLSVPPRPDQTRTGPGPGPGPGPGQDWDQDGTHCVYWYISDRLQKTSTFGFKTLKPK